MRSPGTSEAIEGTVGACVPMILGTVEPDVARACEYVWVATDLIKKSGERRRVGVDLALTADPSGL